MDDEIESFCCRWPVLSTLFARTHTCLLLLYLRYLDSTHPSGLDISNLDSEGVLRTPNKL